MNLTPATANPTRQSYAVRTSNVHQNGNSRLSHATSARSIENISPNNTVSKANAANCERNLFDIWLNQPEIGLSLPFSDRFRSKRTSVCVQIDPRPTPRTVGIYVAISRAWIFCRRTVRRKKKWYFRLG